MANLISGKKSFNDVEVGEYIYIIDPKDSTIKETKVTAKAIHPSSKNKQVLVINFNKVINFDSVTDDALEIAKKDWGIKNTYDQILVDKDADFVILMSKMPTACATKRETLSKWIQNSMGQMKNL